jgi:hypothetical protein
MHSTRCLSSSTASTAQYRAVQCQAISNTADPSSACEVDDMMQQASSWAAAGRALCIGATVVCLALDCGSGPALVSEWCGDLPAITAMVTAKQVLSNQILDPSVCGTMQHRTMIVQPAICQGNIASILSTMVADSHQVPTSRGNVI